MAKPSIKPINKIAVVGTGVIGRGWIYVFSGAGYGTRIYDKDPSQVEKALVWFEETLKQGIADGIISSNQAQVQRSLVSAHYDLKEALTGVEYVQESGTEQLEIKQAIFAEVDKATDQSVIIASSTSALDINDIARDLPGIFRCIMAHPFNPPHIIPVVEVMPTKETDPKVVEQTFSFLKKIGQKPILVKFYINGYIINRIQAAAMREAIHLVESGIADVDAVDTTIRDGLGLRWALLGTFGVNNTNADGGVRKYYHHFRELYRSIMRDLNSAPPSFDDEMIERIGQEVDVMEGDTPIIELCRWRDRMVRKIRAAKDADPHP